MLKRILGVLLILAGVLGIALSVLGIVYTWRTADDATIAAEKAIDLASDTLDNLDRSLDVASTTLDDAVAAVEALHTTTLGVGETLSSTQPTLNGMADLAEEDLAQSLESTQAALGAVEETAGVIDLTLRGLSSLGLGDYDPEVPLDETVASMASGLEPVPQGLREMGDGLRQTGRNLQTVQSGITLMGDHIEEIGKDVDSANGVIESQTEVVRQLHGRVRALQKNVRHPIRLVAWGVTLLLVWIGLSQLALIQWGISLWRRREGG